MSIRIFVEGNDDKKFIITLLNDLKKDKEIEVQDNINFNAYIEVMGCKSHLLDHSNACFMELKDKLKWTIPIDNYIFSKNLDYFLVETINTKACYEYFDKLIACLDVEKLKLNKKPIANLYRDLYPYPQFDFKDNKFNELKTKLKNLFKEQN